MATLTRQPFAPLDGARLQNLTSIKNRQNAAANNGAVKRKAAEVADTDDFENVDPVLFSKRPKGANSFFPSKDLFKPSFNLTKAASTPSFAKDISVLTSPPKTADAINLTTSPRPRAYLQPKSPAAKLNTSIATSTPLSAPAGRSPTRGSKRIGLLGSRRRTSGPYGRVDPPSFNLSPAAPFSLDAALKGTIPSYVSRTSLSPASSLLPEQLHEPEMKPSWFFDIHEDTPEQEMTNLLQHSTCVLDISSDEESERKASRERAEGRDKENIPPPDDVSQTSRAAAARAGAAAGVDDMLIEKMRGPLAEMDAADFYAAGCDGLSVVIVPGDEDEETVVGERLEAIADVDVVVSNTFDFAPQLNPDVEVNVDIDELMGRRDEPAAKAALLEPIEGTGESFELWESGSAKDDAEAPASPVPVAEAAAQ